MQRLVLALPGLLLLLSSIPAGAATFTSTPNTAIPDIDPLGLSDTIDTSGSFGPAELVSSVSVVVSIDHTWVGDLVIDLTSPDGTLLRMLSRARATMPDGQTEGPPFGDSSNLDSANPVSFQDGAATSAETLGIGIGNNASIPAQIVFADADGWTTDITTFAGFIGETAGGNWTLTVADYATQDLGTLVSWSLIIAPEPSTGLLLALGLMGLVFAGRQRSRTPSS